MSKKAYLTLENGTTFEGEFFGAQKDVIGEIVFTTSMTGYLETLTDPSYYGQIILQTFPLIGNYGVIPEDFENSSASLIKAKGYIVKFPCRNPSNFRSERELDAFLKENNVTGLCGIDTRALAKLIRTDGAMNGKISASPVSEADLKEIKNYKILKAVESVSAKTFRRIIGGKYKVALMDFGAKNGIEKALASRDCEVFIFPHNATFEDIINIAPHGIMLSNGPGDPADEANFAIVETVKRLMKTNIPMFGICLGHQLMALASGYKTRKLKFGHRGANQPVKDVSTGRVYVTSQNHGYEVVADNPAFINVNDHSCEGLDYDNCVDNSHNSFSVQFHPEAKGGPLDTSFLFDNFVERVRKHAVK